MREEIFYYLILLLVFRPERYVLGKFFSETTSLSEV